MARVKSEFFKGLIYDGGEASQKEVAEDSIKKLLFKILYDSKLEKGESKALNEIVEQIANKLGLQSNKSNIAQFITTLFQSGEYEFDIDESGNIRANYSRIYMEQKADDKRAREEANAILDTFKFQVKENIKRLEMQKINVTEASILDQFGHEELRKNRNWISLAIDSVLEARNKEK